MGARLDFGILGPLEVRRDGVPVGIGGPRQRALLALLLCNSNRVMSRDRLIEELIAGQPARGTDRILRVQVSRLRTALAAEAEEPRLIARPPGYLLRVEPGELDLDAFEGLVRDGRAALREGEPARATDRLRAADALWRGRPLADVEFERFAQPEVHRLEELRLLGLEDRIEADLALGRHADLCVELATLTSDHPLRERLRGQLMLSLYRCGRQTDALAVYRHTAEMLRDELGLDPGPALRALERSILGQDPRLDGVPRSPIAISDEPPSFCPFKGLEFFDIGDAEYFCGREPVVADLLARVADSSLVGILGPSGSGKSSLLRAGVLAALQAGELPGSADWPQVVLRPGERPCAQLAHALGEQPLDVVLDGLASGERLVIAVDQLEELFTTSEPAHDRTAFLDQLVAAACDEARRAVVIVALRGDFYVRFAGHARFADLLSRGHALVGAMDHDELARAVEQPAARVGLEIERPLVDALVSEAAGQTGGLPLLSAMLRELWDARDGRTLRYASYRASGGMHAAVARMAEAAYARLAEPQRRIARGVMVRLVGEQDGTLTRRRAPSTELEQIDGAVGVLERLIEARLLTTGDGKVELCHEALLREWPRYRTWLEDDQVGRRIHAHLTAAAGDWEAHDLDPSDLYRGARLAGALEWGAHHADRLNSVEREFLDRSRIENERQQQRQRSQNRRLRGLLVAVATLLLVAVGAAIVARVKQRRAGHEARIELARQLGAQAVTEPRLDLAMLMAREAVTLDRSLQTESSLLATLLRSPAVIGTIALPANTTAALGFSPDGRRLAVGDGLGEVRFFDARTHATTATPLGDFGQGQPPTYSSDGKLLAYQTTACGCAVIVVRDAHTLQQVVRLALAGGGSPAPGDTLGRGIAIAPDDRTLYYAYWSIDGAGEPATAYVQRWALPSGRTLPSVRIGTGPLLATRLTDAGSRLLIVTPRSVDVFDAHTLHVVRRAAIRPLPASPAIAAISPDGRTVMLGSRTGGVSFISVSSGRDRSAAGGQDAAVADALYSSDGRTAVTVSDNDTVILWDPRHRRPDELLTGPPGQVAGAALSPDGATLYTSSVDGVLLEWDLAGNRRFGVRSRLGPGSPCCGSLAPPTPPTALSPDGSRFAMRLGPSRVGLFSTRTLRPLASFTITPAGDAVTVLSWSPTGEELAVGGHSGLLQLWRVGSAPRLVRSLTGLRSMFGQPEAIQAVAFSPDGELVAASDDDKSGPVQGLSADNDFASVAVWRAATGTLIAAPSDVNGSLGHGVTAVGDDLLAFSPGGRLLALSLFDRSILILDPLTGQTRQVLISAAGTTSLAFMPDGTLANGTRAGTIELWNPRTGHQVAAPLLVGAAPVTSIAFNAGGQRFATAAQGEGTVKLWLTSGLGQLGPALTTDQGATSTVAFASDGHRLIAVDSDGRGFSWPISLVGWERQACAVAGRGLTHQEWADLGIGGRYTAVCP